MRLRPISSNFKCFISRNINTFIPVVFMTGFMLFSNEKVFAAHPLITDDAGTLGKGKIQIELNGEYAVEKEDGVTEKVMETALGLTYGVVDSLDLIASLPYLFLESEEDSMTENENGISDTGIGVKWGFYEIGQFSFALKPGIIFPTGDYKKGLGTGKAGYELFFINTAVMEPFAFHLNLGYIRNENKFEEEENIWHVSFAGEYSLMKNLRLVANLGMEKNAVPDDPDNPGFILGGAIYSLNENFYLDAGFKYGLNKPETDYSFLAGMTILI